MLMLAEKKYELKEINFLEFVYEMEECEKILKKAIDILIYEPNNSPEGRFLKIAMHELKDLRKNVSLLKKSKS